MEKKRFRARAEKKRLIKRAILVLLGAAILLTATIIGISGIKAIGPMVSEEPRSLNSLPEPGETVKNFFDCIVNGDFEKSAEYLSNYSTLGFSADAEDDKLADFIKTNLLSSYSYEFIGECEAKSVTAVQKVDFTFLETEAIIEELRENASVIAYDKSYEGIEIDEAVANEILYEAITEIEGHIDEYYTTKSITINLAYDGEKWEMELPKELFDAIIGIAE